MVFGIDNILAHARQLHYPSAFRIPWEAPADLARAMLESIGSIIDAPPAAEEGVKVGDLIQVANQCFRIQRNVDALDAAGASTKETRMITRATKTMRTLLEENHVLVMDPTGEVFDDGRLDFEIAGEPEASSSVSRPTITFCERPIVTIKGKIVQRGKGIVSKPN